MKNPHKHLYTFAGAWFSLVAIVIGGSILLPPETTSALPSTASVYKFPMSDEPTKDEKAPAYGRAVIVNLQTMQLSLFEDAVPVKTFPILSKGRSGTPWETPAGAYAIQLKERKHFSSIGGVWMPYSMQFYGNFFIHGWPTYSNGEDVPPGYSGGCIRMATKDASEVYEFIPKGAKIIVLNSVDASDFATSSRYYYKGDGALPTISAGAFMVQDVDSGKILWERDARAPRDPKGFTLLATGLTALETVNQYKIVRMSELLLGTSVLRRQSIGAIDEMPVGTLIYPLLFDESDTAAKAFAREHGTKQFVRYMNEKARAIGMKDTEFSGALSTSGATSTAADIATLLRYVDKQKKFLIDVTMAKEKTLTDENGDKRYTWSNQNPWILSEDAMYRGGIVSTDAENVGGAMVIFSIPVTEFGTRKVAIVFLGSSDIQGDVDTLRKFIGENFVYGIEKESVPVIPEEKPPTSWLRKKIADLINLSRLFRDQIIYEREV